MQCLILYIASQLIPPSYIKCTYSFCDIDQKNGMNLSVNSCIGTVLFLPMSREYINGEKCGGSNVISHTTVFDGLVECSVDGQGMQSVWHEFQYLHGYVICTLVHHAPCSMHLEKTRNIYGCFTFQQCSLC